MKKNLLLYNLYFYNFLYLFKIDHRKYCFFIVLNKEYHYAISNTKSLLFKLVSFGFLTIDLT